MHVKPGLPPNIEQIRAKIGDIPSNFVFTYGDTIYLQANEKLPEHLEIHESVHAIQQGHNPKEWWDKYLADPLFRLEQELEAYRTQYKWVKQRGTPSKYNSQVLFLLAHDLCSHYGLSISHTEAESKIRKEPGRVIFRT